MIGASHVATGYATPQDERLARSEAARRTEAERIYDAPRMAWHAIDDAERAIRERLAARVRHLDAEEIAAYEVELLERRRRTGR